MEYVIDTDNTRFFLAICKLREHSFVMAGVYDGSQVLQLLARIGKVPDTTDIGPGKALCNMCFFGNKSFFQDEEVVKEPGSPARAISYEAYDINYSHYLELVRILEALQTKSNEVQCFKPVSQQGSKIELKLTSTLMVNMNQEPVADMDSYCTVHASNNCRHGAIKIIENSAGYPISKLVSNNFLVHFPGRTLIVDSKPSNAIPFYVLPPPPTTYQNLDPTRQAILKKLFKRMSKMVALHPEAQETVAKFTALKDLYTQQIVGGPDLSLDELLTSVLAWNEVHKEELSVLRKRYFWDKLINRRAASELIVEEITQSLLHATTTIS